MSKISDFMGRSLEMSEIIEKLDIHKNRLVTVEGIPGIGKTTITKSVGFFLEEREKFMDGIIYISMSKRKEADMLITQLYQ